MGHITIRGIPKELDEELRSEAKRRGTSLNKTVVDYLKKAAGHGENRSTKRRDLASVAGKWTAEQAAEFDRHVAVFESLDEELWQ